MRFVIVFLVFLPLAYAAAIDKRLLIDLTRMYLRIFQTLLFICNTWAIYLLSFAIVRGARVITA